MKASQSSIKLPSDIYFQLQCLETIISMKKFHWKPWCQSNVVLITVEMRQTVTESSQNNAYMSEAGIY